MADPNTQRERKTWQRGQQSEFRIKILNKDGTPMSLDTTKYPAFGIYAPNGTLFQQGVMQQFGPPGSYRTLWTVPTNVELSNDRASWTFEVTAVRSKDMKQFQMTQDFNVVEKRSASRDNRNVVQLGVAGAPYRAIWRGDFEPESLGLQMYFSDYPEDPTQAPIPVELTKSSFTQVIDGNTIAYYYDVPGTSLQRNGDYTIIWNVRETATAPIEMEYEQVRVIKKSIIKHLPSLRFAVERLPMDPDAPQKISDADLMEAMTYGTHSLNSYHPISNYPMDNIPSQLQAHWMMLCVRWMLSSQHLVLAAQAFNFSGQTVSLDFDQTGAMEAAISRMDSWIQETLPPAKLATNRLLTSNMALGIRSSRPIGYNNRVFKYEKVNGSGNNSPLLAALSSLGMIP